MVRLCSAIQPPGRAFQQLLLPSPTQIYKLISITRRTPVREICLFDHRICNKTTMSFTQSSISLLSVCTALLTLTGVFANSHHGVRKRSRQPAPSQESSWPPKPHVLIPSVLNPPPDFRAYNNNPDFPDWKAAVQRLRQGWIDMWQMAAVACVLLDEQEELYQRYFEPGEPELVRCELRSQTYHWFMLD